MKTEVKEMIEAIENAIAVAAENGFDGVYFKLEEIANGLANHYGIER